MTKMKTVRVIDNQEVLIIDTTEGLKSYEKVVYPVDLVKVFTKYGAKLIGRLNFIIDGRYPNNIDYQIKTLMEEHIYEFRKIGLTKTTEEYDKILDEDDGYYYIESFFCGDKGLIVYNEENLFSWNLMDYIEFRSITMCDLDNLEI